MRRPIEIPGLASWLATRDSGAEVPGLDAVPLDERPPVNIVHWSFQVMVGLGSGLLALAVWFVVAWWRRRDLPMSRWFWRFAAGSGVASILAMESGWIPTEVGRQPWIVYGLVRTEDAVSAAGGIVVTATVISVIYLALGAITIAVLRSMSKRFSVGGEVATPYGPFEEMVP